MSNFRFEIVEKLGVLSKRKNGWQKELNLIKWNNGVPVYDLRNWPEGHEKPGKGVALSIEEVKELRETLNWLELD